MPVSKPTRHSSPINVPCQWASHAGLLLLETAFCWLEREWPEKMRSESRALGWYAIVLAPIIKINKTKHKLRKLLDVGCVTIHFDGLLLLARSPD